MECHSRERAGGGGRPESFIPAPTPAPQLPSRPGPSTLPGPVLHSTLIFNLPLATGRQRQPKHQTPEIRIDADNLDNSYPDECWRDFHLRPVQVVSLYPHPQPHPHTRAGTAVFACTPPPPSSRPPRRRLTTRTALVRIRPRPFNDDTAAPTNFLPAVCSFAQNLELPELAVHCSSSSSSTSFPSRRDTATTSPPSQNHIRRRRPSPPSAPPHVPRVRDNRQQRFAVTLAPRVRTLVASPVSTTRPPANAHHSTAQSRVHSRSRLDDRRQTTDDRRHSSGCLHRPWMLSHLAQTPASLANLPTSARRVRATA